MAQPTQTVPTPAAPPGPPLGPTSPYYGTPSPYGPPAARPYGAGPYAPPPFAPRYDPAQLANADRTATNALWCSILGLFCCAILPILGLVFGGTAISQLNKMGVRSHPARGKAIAAIVIGSIVLLINFVAVIASIAEQ